MSRTMKPLCSAVMMAVAFSGATLCSGQEPDAQAASPEKAVQATTAEEEETPEVSTRLSERALNVLYTKTNLSLAELELQRALELNSGNYKVVPRLTIERLRSNLAIAKEQYEQAKLDSGEGPEKVRIKHARERLRIAEIDMQAADELSQKNSISEWEYKRVELKLDLAKLNLALMQHPTGYMTLMDGMQRQIDRLGVEILAIDQRLSKLEGSELTR